VSAPPQAGRSRLVRTRATRLHPDLEVDFLNQKTLLLRLIAERLKLADRTPAAAALDEQITKAKALVRSYRILKLYEGYEREG